MTDRLRIKASSSNVFAPASMINATINGHKGKVSVVREYRAISVKYTWKELGGPNHNNCRPHESLDNMTPMEYREKKKVG